MAGTDLLAATHLTPQVLYSGQLPDAADHALFTVPAAESAVVKHAVACNTSGASVTLTVSIVPSGGAADGTHRVLSAMPIAAGDSLPLTDLLGEACLGTGDSIHAQASAATAIDLVITGVVAS